MSLPYRIVLVDDQERVRRLISEWLVGDERFEVIGEAADGAAAVEVVARLQPDAVLLDLRMPKMQGGVALQHMRRRSPGTAVVVLSGHDDLLAEARKLGADGIFPKGGSLAAALDGLFVAVASRRARKASG